MVLLLDLRWADLLKLRTRNFIESCSTTTPSWVECPANSDLAILILEVKAATGSGLMGFNPELMLSSAYRDSIPFE